jgi:hypothetical protein
MSSYDAASNICQATERLAALVTDTHFEPSSLLEFNGFP